MASGRYAFLSDWARVRIRKHLDEIADAVQQTIGAFDSGETCDVILARATDLRRQAQKAEEVILEHHLQTCLLPEMHGLAEIGASVARLRLRVPAGRIHGRHVPEVRHPPPRGGGAQRAQRCAGHRRI